MDYWPLIETIAEKFGIQRTALANWKRVGVVPRMWRHDFYLTAKAMGKKLPPEAFEPRAKR